MQQKTFLCFFFFAIFAVCNSLGSSNNSSSIECLFCVSSARVKKFPVPCDIKDGRDNFGACKPESDYPTTFQFHQPWISSQDFMHNQLNLTWSQKIPNNVVIRGFIVRLYTFYEPIGPPAECYFIQFNSNSVKIKSEKVQEFKANNLPWKKLQRESIVTIFPVIHAWKSEEVVIQSDLQVGKEIISSTAYNKEEGLLKVNINSNYTESIYGFFCGYELKIFKSQEEYFTTDVYPNEDTIFISFKPSHEAGSDDWKIKICPLRSIRQRCICEGPVQTVTTDFSRNDPIHRTSDLYIRNSEAELTINFGYFWTSNTTLSFSFEATQGSLRRNAFFIGLAERNGSSCNKYVRLTQVYFPALSVRFDGLNPGNYCVDIHQISFICYGNWLCPKLKFSAKDITLSEDPVVTRQLSAASPTSEEVGVWPILIIISVAVILISFTILILWMCKIPAPVSSLSYPEEVTTANIVKKIEQQEAKQVWLVWNMKNSRNRKIVEHAVPVFENFLHIKVIKRSSSYNTIAALGYTAWVEKTMKTAEKVIFVEPDYDVEKFMDSTNYFPSSEEENIFLHALRFVSGSKSIATKSLIIRFQAIHSYQILESTIVNKTWSVPTYLAALFNYIHGERANVIELQTMWENEPCIIKLKDLSVVTPAICHI